MNVLAYMHNLSNYFVNKINNLKLSILGKLSNFTVAPQFPEQPYSGQSLRTFHLSHLMK